MQHPLMTDLLSSIRAMPQVIQAATVYRPRVGRRSRSYLSASDVLAYEAGYLTFPGGDVPQVHTPAADGWFDAEAEHFDRLADMARGCDD